jgi:hypothetical protein
MKHAVKHIHFVANLGAPTKLAVVGAGGGA